MLITLIKKIVYYIKLISYSDKIIILVHNLQISMPIKKIIRNKYLLELFIKNKT